MKKDPGYRYEVRSRVRKQPVFGILYRNGTVWTEVDDDVGVSTLQTLIS